jgi:hypothetical protein
MTPEPAKMQHVAYFDEGAFHWMSGIAPRDCELYAPWRSQTPEPAQPAEAWLNDPASLESGEPAQPAESPEALLIHLQRMPMTEWVWTDAQRIFGVLAASTARPTERGAVEGLREASNRLLLAMTTRALRGRDHVPSMREEQDAASALREALAQPATDQAAGVERYRKALETMCLAVEYSAGCDEGITPDEASSEIMSYAGAYLATAYDEARAALATQPATGRTMGGEAPSEDWLAEVLDDSLDMDWTGRVGAQAIIREWDRRYVD